MAASATSWLALLVAVEAQDEAAKVVDLIVNYRVVVLASPGAP